MALRSAIIVDVFAVEGVNLARQVTWGCEKGIKHPVRSVKLRNNEKSGCSLKREKKYSPQQQEGDIDKEIGTAATHKEDADGRHCMKYIGWSARTTQRFS